jgi:glycosyltransferase involved in cell wall biosynthesis
MEKVTFVISTYEDIPTTIDTINSLLATTQGYEKDIIVVDDASTVRHELDVFPEVKVYRNETRRGVGYSLDKGVRLSETDIVVIQGNDIRYEQRDWLPGFYQAAVDNPKSIIAGVTLGLNMERQQITGNENKFYAAHTLFEVTTENNPRVLPFRRYIEAKWSPKAGDGVYKVGCVLGAIYAVNKSFFEKISSWGSHRVWGSLEPWISISYAINGGNSLVDTNTNFGHLFRTASSHKPINSLIYNKLAVAYMYLPTDMEKVVFDWCKTLQHSEMSFIYLEQNKPELDKFRKLKLELGDDEVRRRIKKTGVLD